MSAIRQALENDVPAPTRVPVNRETHLELDVRSVLRGAVEAWQMGSEPAVTVDEVGVGVWKVSVFGVHVGMVDKRGRRRFVSQGRPFAATTVRKSLDAAVLSLISGGAR